MKKIITIALFFGGFIHTTIAQDDPIIDAIYLSDSEPFCFDGTTKTLTVVVTDINGDAVTINYPTYTNNFLEAFNPLTSVVGNTTTYVFPISINYATPPPAGVLSLEDLQVIATTSNGLDPTMSVSGSLSGIEVNGQIDVFFTTALLQICNTGNPIDLN
ncbi:MAG: hypothetical protein IPO32_07250 [Crocinitomicaceae bacterium]|nr:hypothetical protein [Crocinitomicaceae bacterium]